MIKHRELATLLINSSIYCEGAEGAAPSRHGFHEARDNGAKDQSDGQGRGMQSLRDRSRRLLRPCRNLQILTKRMKFLHSSRSFKELQRAVVV
uniref:Uncharacterized protein n=1 Tax=Physcomitrium patens TaxID=3218 RepID=A0A2K1KXG5_PHYPA|nr:hypothetical protein PHYPA_005472 [Physcomitrium patens]